jgi:hypothetical protein
MLNIRLKPEKKYKIDFYEYFATKKKELKFEIKKAKFLGLISNNLLRKDYGMDFFQKGNPKVLNMDNIDSFYKKYKENTSIATKKDNVYLLFMFKKKNFIDKESDNIDIATSKAYIAELKNNIHKDVYFIFISLWNLNIIFNLVDYLPIDKTLASDFLEEIVISEKDSIRIDKTLFTDVEIVEKYGSKERKSKRKKSKKKKSTKKK